MLLLVTVLLVLAGAILLIIGFLANSLAYIFVSIACAAIAAVALVVFSRLTRRRALRLAADGPIDPVGARPAVDTRPDAGYRSPGATTTARGAAFAAGGASTTAPMTVPPGVAPAHSPSEDAWDDAEDDWDEEDRQDEADWEDEPDWGDEVVFPIEDYDELRVAEIVPLLPELDPDELEEVRDREASGKARGTILTRIDELLGETATAATPAVGRAEPPGPFGAGSAAPRSDGSMPPGFTVKAKLSSGLYHAPESRYYTRTTADAWFATEEDARGAGFIRWDARQERSGQPARRAPSKTAGSKAAGSKAAGSKAAAAKAAAGGAAPAPARKDTTSTGKSTAAAKSTGRSTAAGKTTGAGKSAPPREPRED